MPTLPRRTCTVTPDEEAEPREYPEYILPNSDFGDPECCGLFYAVDRGDTADITCNECGFVLRTERMSDVQRVRWIPCNCRSMSLPRGAPIAVR